MNKSGGHYLTIQIFHFNTPGNKLRAFADMGRRTLNKKNKSPLFIRHLGSGAGEGFSLVPDFSTYSLVAVWGALEAAQQHLEYENYRPAWSEYCDERFQLILQCTKVHGQWDGNQALIADPDANTKPPVAVLTRARIKFNKLPRFWKHVPRSSMSISNAKACLFSKGIGEWPLISLATFSIWNSLEEMQKFAYGNSVHGEIVQKARAEDWFSEELFARFHIMEARGTYKGFSAKNIFNAKTQP